MTRTAHTDTFRKAGIEYARVAATSTFTVKAQGRSYRSSTLQTERHEDVGALARTIAKRSKGHATWLFVSDLAWMAQDGTCKPLTRSCYRFRDGRWEHFSGARIIALDEAGRE